MLITRKEIGGYMLEMIQISAVVVISLLFIPETWLVFLIKFPGLSPNWITLWRIPLFYIGIYYALDMQVNSATFAISLALMLDNTDGRAARASKIKICTAYADNPCLKTFWEELNFPGKTSIGEWLDPLADKLQAIPGLFVQIVLSPYQLWWVIVAIVLFIATLVAEAIGTVIRPPFRTSIQVKEVMKTWMRGSKATGIGKAKTIIMFTAFGLFVARFMLLYSEEWFCPELLFVLTPILAWLSVLSKTRLAYVMKRWGKGNVGQKLDFWVDSFTKKFEL